MDATTQKTVEHIQKAFCRELGTGYDPAPPESILGFAVTTKGQLPINGLRHPPAGGTNGWYLWCGETYSPAPDFFVSTHAKHAYEDLPSVSKLLGLPPGYRFLAAGGTIDIWFDENLLKV